jgi:hypothetical protein
MVPMDVVSAVASAIQAIDQMDGKEWRKISQTANTVSRNRTWESAASQFSSYFMNAQAELLSAV